MLYQWGQYPQWDSLCLMGVMMQSRSFLVRLVRCRWVLAWPDSEVWLRFLRISDIGLVRW